MVHGFATMPPHIKTHSIAEDKLNGATVLRFEKDSSFVSDVVNILTALNPDILPWGAEWRKLVQFPIADVCTRFFYDQSKYAEMNHLAQLL